MKELVYALVWLYAAEVNLNDSGKLVSAQFSLKYEKKSYELYQTDVILLVSKDHIIRIRSYI